MGNKLVSPKDNYMEKKKKLIKELYDKYSESKKNNISINNDLLNLSIKNRNIIDLKIIEEELNFKKEDYEKNNKYLNEIIELYRSIFNDLSTNKNEQLTFDIFDCLVTKGNFNKNFIILKYIYDNDKYSYEKYYNINHDILKYLFESQHKNKLLNQKFIIVNKESILYNLKITCSYTINESRMMFEIYINFGNI